MKPQSKMTDAEHAARDAGYEAGERAALLAQLKHILKQLGYTDNTVANAITEREDAIIFLRGLCAEFGDNEWDEKLHLYDILDKHLGDHLRAP